MASPLNKPFTLPCGVTLPNRIVKASLTETLANPATDAPNEQHVELFRLWGTTGAAVLLTGNMMVDRRYLECPGNVVVEDERDLEMLKKWAKEAQANGSQLWGQISHPGRQCPISVSTSPVAPSPGPPLPIILPAFSKPRGLTVDEIEEIITRFATAAKILKTAGFSGVQIHSAHGYLLSQFLSPIVNKRTDHFGGSLENRATVLLRVCRAVRAAVGPNFPIAVKLNSADFQKGGFSEDDSLAVIAMLEKESIDLLEISGGTYEAAAMMGTVKLDSTRKREAYFLQFAARVRANTKLPLLVTGGFRTVKFMEEVISSGEVDFIGMGRTFTLYVDEIREILSGTSKLERSLSLPNLSLGIKHIDGGIENVWYQHQIHLLSRKKKPNLNHSRIWGLTTDLVLLYFWSPRKASLTTNLLVFFCVSVGTVLGLYAVSRLF